MRRFTTTLLAAAVLATAAPADPQPTGITWYGTWEGALRDAKRTKRPILLVSAAPHCRNVPGIW